jgi:hypothetical protein
MKTVICGIPFEIVMRQPNARDDNNYGKGDGKHAVIFIDDTMPKSIKDATLVHEWMHQVYECNGITHEELQVAVMATELYRQGFRVKIEK